jgi:tetratricopeptide (TPR) repeat protein
MKILLLLFISINVWAVSDEAIETAFDNNETTAVEKLVKQITKEDDNYNKRDYYLARVYFRNNELDDAEEYLEKALKAYPQAETYNLAGGIYGTQAGQASIFSKLGYAKKSKKYLQKAYDADPTNVAYISGLIQFNIQAPGIAGGDMDAVESLLKQMEKYNKKQAIILRIQYLIEEEDEETALRYLDEEISKNPSNVGLVYSKGFLFQSMEENDKAVIQYNKAIAQETKNESDIKAHYDALYQLGRLASIEKKWLEEGKQAFVEFIKHEKIAGTPPKSWANYRLGLIYKALKQNKLAQQSFNASLALNPDKELEKRIKKAMP